MEDNTNSSQSTTIIDLFSTPIIRTIEELLAEVERDKGKRVFVLFVGAPLANGESWCPDCRAAEPVIQKALKKLPANGVFVRVEVGDREMWRNPNNVFRKDARCKVSSVPTLIEFNTCKRLSGNDILKEELIELMFEED